MLDKPKTELPLMPSHISRAQMQYAKVIDSVEKELFGVDITPYQAILIMELGDNTITTGEVLRRMFYIGKNPSYNLKDLCKKGYLLRQRIDNDGRKVMVSLTKEGLKLCARLRGNLTPA